MYVVMICKGDGRDCAALSLERNPFICTVTQLMYTCVCCVGMIQVLLMLWNSALPWGDKEYQFVELFSGVGNVSREWSGAHLGKDVDL